MGGVDEVVEVIERNWTGCYRDGWTSILHPDAFCHPAKVSRGLARRIYQHAIEQGWIRRGSVVVDPFAGIGGFALHAMQNGLCFIGVELEEKFVLLGQQNIDLWNERYGSLLPGWGSAVVVQGDSRRLVEVLREADVLCSSPPYISGGHHTDQTGTWGGQRQSVPEDVAGYGKTEGQLAQMPKGDVQAILASPPYADSMSSEKSGIDWSQCHREDGSLRDMTREPAHAHRPGAGGEMRYGESEGQLGKMSVVSNPPYEGTELSGGGGIANEMRTMYREGQNYGDADAQIGAMQRETFWSAARTIMQQCYQVLSPNSVAIWVLKSFVRDKKIVNFPDRWRQLGESCGFETIEWIRAWLVEGRGAQYTLEGELEKRKVERKSFFRRLYERKARAAKLWPSLPRDDRARCLMTSHRVLWNNYEERLESPDEMHPPIYPTKGRIISRAQMIAYVEAGKPDIDIDIAIEYEIVLVQRKPALD